MPCYKCNNGKYKYGERGRCQFDTLSACQAAERAIHARENKKDMQTVAGCNCKTCDCNSKDCNCKTTKLQQLRYYHTQHKELL